MKTYKITLGLNDKHTKTQLIPTAAAHEKLERVMLRGFEIYAYTTFDCKGHYRHNNGTLVSENSIRIEIASDVQIDRKIYRIIRALKKVFNQESIMLEMYESNVQFR